MSRRILILCPLEIERRSAIHRVGASCEVRRIGPGAGAVARAMETINPHAYSLVVLFGVAGGLAPTDRAPVVAEVVDRKTGERWRPSGAEDGTGVTLVGVDEPVSTPAAKRGLHAQFSASLVDCESHEFARRCTAIDVRWAVVRGVSDGPDEALPAQSARWVTRDGRTRLAGVVRSCARHPGIVGSLLELRRQTNMALAAAGDRLVSLVAQDAERIPR